jgi:hypothetical protein
MCNVHIVYARMLGGRCKTYNETLSWKLYAYEESPDDLVMLWPSICILLTTSAHGSIPKSHTGYVRICIC